MRAGLLCVWLLLIGAVVPGAGPACADDPPVPLSDAAAVAHLNRMCVGCHQAKKAGGDVRLDRPVSQIDEETWDKIVRALHHRDMPPVEAKLQPEKVLRGQLEAWAQGQLDRHLLKRAGDPGEFVWRRLTTIEFENMVRDLTSHVAERGGSDTPDGSRRAASGFAVTQHISVRDILGQDTTGGEGFSNIGSAQNSMTASLLDKYLAVSQRVAEHARFNEHGQLVFDPADQIVSPRVREDRAIIDLERLNFRVLGHLFLGPGRKIEAGGDGREVRSKNVATEREWRGLGRYLTSVWLATAAPDPSAALPGLAERFQLSPRFLARVWQNWTSCEPGSLESMLWVDPIRSLPNPTSLQQEPPDAVRQTCDAVGSAFWQVLRQHASRIPRDRNRVEGFPCTTQPLFTAISSSTLDGRANRKMPIHEPPLFIAVRTADGKPAPSDLFLGRPQIRITETRTETVDGKERRTNAVSHQPLPVEHVGSVRGQWSDHTFDGFDEPRSMPALAFRTAVALKLDLTAVGRLQDKVIDADGRIRKGVAVDVVFPIDMTGDVAVRHESPGGSTNRTARAVPLLQVSISRERSDLDLAGFAELTRFSVGRADKIDQTWLAADTETRDAYRQQFVAMAERWPPLAPLQMAPFGGDRVSEVPPEMMYFRDDARMQQWVMTDAEREQSDALWRYTCMLCGEHDRRLRQFEERFGVTTADRKKEEMVRQAIATRTPQGREPNHGHGVAPPDYVARWEYYRRTAAEDAAFWRKRTLAAVEDFAARAWRRPLTQDEVAQFAEAHDAMGALAARDAELVLRALVARVLLSPHFIYRVVHPGGDGGETPLSAWELASRLSMTLWASLPDDELRRHAADGSLLRDEVLRAQTRRMLADPRAGGNGLAEHFFGQWLGFAGFGASTRGPDATVFPEFTPSVRRSLHAESIAFFEDLIRNDRDVRLMIDGDYSFLDPVLRSYYGLEPTIQPSPTREPREPVGGSKAEPEGLAVWLDASDASTIVQSGGRVRQWQDKSGRQNHLTQTKDALQPVYQADAIHSLPAVVFDRQLLASGEDRFAFDKHLILVVAQADQVNQNDFLGSGGTGPGDVLLMNYQQKYRGHFWSGGKLTVLDSSQPAVTGPAIYVHHSDGQRLSIRRNGSLDLASPLGGPPDGKRRNLILGSRQANGGSFVGRIAEVIVIFGDVPAADVMKAEAYLAHKWKLADRLPTDHPGKAAPPSNVMAIFAPARSPALPAAGSMNPAEPPVRVARIPASGESAAVNGFVLTDMRPASRGGVLGLGAILINNSRQKRTSPTNRGVWVVEKLLGRHIPAPPPNVNPLPDEPESRKGESLREQIERHSRDAACASCHRRIDPYGYSLEAFDAIGRRRPREYVESLAYAEDRDGRRIEGVAGLQSYLQEHEAEVLRSMTRHFVGYALNRGALASDRPLIDRIVLELPRNDYRFSTIVEQLVLSRQFRFHRK